MVEGTKEHGLAIPAPRLEPLPVIGRYLFVLYAVLKNQHHTIWLRQKAQTRTPFPSRQAHCPGTLCRFMVERRQRKGPFWVRAMW